MCHPFPDLCNIWEKGCPKAVYEKFAPKGLEIVSISIDKDAAAWQKALEEERLPWRNFRDETGVADAYSVSAIPAIFLVDGSGTMQWHDYCDRFTGNGIAGEAGNLASLKAVSPDL